MMFQSNCKELLQNPECSKILVQVILNKMHVVIAVDLGSKDSAVKIFEFKS